jgi:microcompartment protein CcmK/EutM
MVLAKVVGTVVSTAKASQLDSLKLLLIEKITIPDLKGTKDYLVALDAVGANVGEYVFYVTGSSARMTDVSKGKPADATITAIIDSIDLEGAPVYQKSTHQEG